jgi:hypothetical protein
MKKNSSIQKKQLFDSLIYTFLSFCVIFSKKYRRKRAASSTKQFQTILSAKADTKIKVKLFYFIKNEFFN